jgi:two-component system LytT family response regulator
MISILLVDDEPLANQRMRGLLAAHPGVKVTAEAGSLAEARAHLSTDRPDAVFLDVEMPGGNAFALLSDVADSTQVVFITAHDRHAVEAFAVAAVDYLMKPVSPERLAETIRRLRPRSRELPGGQFSRAASGFRAAAAAGPDPGAVTTVTVPLRQRGRKTVVAISDICWIESLRNYTRVALRRPSRVLVFRRRLGEWLSDLPEQTFARLSRSEVVQLVLVNGTEWKSRSETIVSFSEGVEPLTLGRVSAVRLGRLLEGDGGQAG